MVNRICLLLCPAFPCRTRRLRPGLWMILLFAATACGPAQSVDQQLQAIIAAQNLRPVPAGPAQAPALVALGQALFFDKILSGNGDIACATCHHPQLHSGDDLAVSIGTGGRGLGPARQLGAYRRFIPRNAPEIFNRGMDEWRTMFWDSRVAMTADGRLISPAGVKLPDGLEGVLAVQAMFPVTSADEMRGQSGDVDVAGHANTLAELAENDLPAMWEILIKRLLAYPGYVTLFQAAYPDVPTAQLGFEHAARAIAAFEIDAFTLTGSPWNRYLLGDVSALSPTAKEGALLFYGAAGCSGCHSGSLFTDQEHHVLAAPQVGPGKGYEAPLDLGRFRITGDPLDKFAFRTPPLHNVSVTGPWMHDGAYATLEAVILHHLDPAASLRQYNPAQHLPPALQGTFQQDPELLAGMLSRTDPLLAAARRLSPAEVQALIAFLDALTDPAVAELSTRQPAAVPSGLPVSDDEPAPGAH